MKKVFTGKSYWNKGTRHEVLGSTDKAILIEIKKAGRLAYQVIDFCEDYPEKESELEELNIYRTVFKDHAMNEFTSRNQLSIE